MRGSGFCRLSQLDFKKSMDRAMCQVHGYSRIGSQYEYDKMNSLKKARNGDFDKACMAKYGKKAQ